MAIPRKGSRKITVDGENYRWLIRRKATYGQVDYGVGRLNVAIEHADIKGAVLCIYTDKDHPQNYARSVDVSVTPADIAKWIKEALTLNWNSKKQGSQMYVKIEDGKMMKL